MASPAIAGTVAGGENGTINTSHTGNLVTGLSVGDWYFFCAVTPGVAIGNSTTGVVMGSPIVNFHDGTNCDIAVWKLQKAGGEAASLTFTTSTNIRSAHISWGVSGTNGTVDASSGTTANNPPSLSPAGGSNDYLFVALIAGSASDYTLSAQANYTLLSQFGNASSSATSRCKTGMSYRALTASSDDPAAFGSSGGAGPQAPVTLTLAVNPTSGAAAVYLGGMLIGVG